MDALMAKPDYFEKWLTEKFESAEASFRLIRADLKANTKLTQEISKKQDYTNGKVKDLDNRVTRLESVNPHTEPKPQNDKLWKDPAVIKIALYLSLALLLLVAGAVGMDISKLL